MDPSISKKDECPVRISRWLVCKVVDFPYARKVQRVAKIAVPFNAGA